MKLRNIEQETRCDAAESSTSASKRWPRPSVAMMALSLVVTKSSPVTAFVPTPYHHSKSSSLNFRHGEGYDSFQENAAAAEAAMNFMQQAVPQAYADHTAVPQHYAEHTAYPQHYEDQTAAHQYAAHQYHYQEQPVQMPAWLSNINGHLAEEKLSTLLQAMVNTYLTHSEASTVISAIRDASEGDPTKMAGAADFCLILVDTMEMGMATLVAAAFHHVTCVTAREKRALFSPSSLSYSTSSWEQIFSDYIGGIEAYDMHAARIATGAAHLKRTETVASSFNDHSSSNSGRANARESENLRSLLLSESEDWRSLAIRTAACLYRLRGIVEDINIHDRRLSPEEVRVARNAFHIFSPLASRLGMHRLKNEIEGTAFRLLYPRQYNKITSLTHQFRLGQTKLKVGDGMKNVLTAVNAKVEQLIENDPYFKEHISEIVTSSRVKEPFSLWKKMLKLGTQNILEVPDAIAIRIVLSCKKLTPDEDDEVTRARERALSYYVQQLCVGQFHPLQDGRFKDYIERPKQNGYQSLHYTAETEWGGEQWPFEIQVRSGEMHKVAEYGLAAHWDYKDHIQSIKPDPNADTYTFKLDQSSEAYLRSVQEWHWRNSRDPSTYESSYRVSVPEERFTPYLESFNAAKSSIARENVFIFVSSPSDSNVGGTNGNILELPSGACVLDALREIERRFGVDVDLRTTSPESFVYNGSVENVTTKLNNADILTISYQDQC